MESKIILIYATCDEVLKALRIQDDPQAVMTNAEVMSFAIIAAKLFNSNHRLTRWLCIQLRYYPHLLSNSRLNRRIHQIPWEVWMAVFRFLALVFNESNPERQYAVDSFPVAWCAKSRIDRRHQFLKKEYIGYSAAKKRHFCGIKVHMLVTARGEPVEVTFRPASENDLSVLWTMRLDIPAKSILYADGAYNSYDLEEILDEEGIQLLAKRRINSKRGRSIAEEKQISSRRQIVETAFSCITGLLPRSIKAVTERGFLIKIMSAVLAYSLSCLA